MHPSKYQWQKIECIKISSSQNYHLSTNYPPWLITCIIVPSCGQSGVFAELPWPPCSEEANDIGESFSSKVFARWVIGTHMHVMYTFKYIIYMIQMIYTRIHGVHMYIYIYLCRRRYILYTWCVCLYSYMHSVYIYISENSLDIIYNSSDILSHKFSELNLKKQKESQHPHHACDGYVSTGFRYLQKGFYRGNMCTCSLGKGNLCLEIWADFSFVDAWILEPEMVGFSAKDLSKYPPKV